MKEDEFQAFGSTETVWIGTTWQVSVTLDCVSVLPWLVHWMHELSNHGRHPSMSRNLAGPLSSCADAMCKLRAVTGGGQTLAESLNLCV